MFELPEKYKESVNWKYNAQIDVKEKISNGYGCYVLEHIDTGNLMMGSGNHMQEIITWVNRNIQDRLFSVEMFKQTKDIRIHVVTFKTKKETTAAFKLMQESVYPKYLLRKTAVHGLGKKRVKL